MRAPSLPMSYERCARSCAAAHARRERIERQLAARGSETAGSWTLANLPEALGAYKGADVGRLTADWIASCMSPDDEVRGSLRRLRARARELERNNSWAASYLNLACANVIGPTGFRHRACVTLADGETADAAVNREIHEAWERWCERPTLDGKFSLSEFEHQAFRTHRRDGEALVRLWRGADFPFGLALEGVDADVLDESYSARAVSGQNEVRLGVEVDRYARPLAYHVFEGMYRYGGDQRRVRVPAEDILHLYRPKRMNQARGVTEFLPVMIALRMLDAYEEAELIASRIGASKMMFFVNKKENAPEGELGGAGAKKPIVMDAAPGTGEQLPAGWEMQQFDPTHPTTAYPAFVKSALRKVAAGLGVSYSALASDLEAVNYSSMRSGLLIERETWRTLQHWWIGAFRQRVYREWLNTALLSGDLSLPSMDYRRYTAARWSGRGWAAVDPLKDATATILETMNGLGTRTGALADEGEDFEETVDRLAEELEYAGARGVDIEGGAAAGAKAGDTGDAADKQQDDEAAATAAKANRNGGAALDRRELLRLALRMVAGERD